MALVKCPDCGKDVSDAAPACPACGRPIAPPLPTPRVPPAPLHTSQIPAPPPAPALPYTPQIPAPPPGRRYVRSSATSWVVVLGSVFLLWMAVSLLTAPKRGGNDAKSTEATSATANQDSPAPAKTRSFRDLPEWQKESTRVVWAERTEKSFRDDGFDASVRVTGPNKTELIVRFPLLNRELAGQLFAKRKEDWKNVGFRKVSFTDGVSFFESFEIR
jgi:hypothetical protein